MVKSRGICKPSTIKKEWGIGMAQARDTLGQQLEKGLSVSLFMTLTVISKIAYDTQQISAVDFEL